VRFQGDENGDEGGNRTFVYAVTASGWHTGALAVRLDSEEGTASTVKEENEPIIKLQNDEQDARDEALEAQNEGNGAGPTGGSWMARLGRPFRVGFAGRGGANVGGAGGGVRPPSR
jgi:SCF-associated factor 1